MKRPVAMILAGAFTVVAVIGGTVAAVQTGVFASSTVTIQANGEINVPTSEPATEQSPATIEVQPVQPTDLQTVTEAVADPIEIAAPIVVVDTNRETALMARLNEAYKLMKERDDAYQAKLMEAYARLQANQAGTSGRGADGGSTAGSSDSSQSAQSTAVIVAPVPAAVVRTGDQRTGDQHTANQHTRNSHTSNTRTNAQQNNGNQQRNNDQQHTRTQSNTDSQQHNNGRKESGDH